MLVVYFFDNILSSLERALQPLGVPILFQNEVDLLDS